MFVRGALPFALVTARTIDEKFLFHELAGHDRAARERCMNGTVRLDGLDSCSHLDAETEASNTTCWAYESDSGWADGFGAQYGRQISIYAKASFHGGKFLYRPSHKIGGGYGYGAELIDKFSGLSALSVDAASCGRIAAMDNVDDVFSTPNKYLTADVRRELRRAYYTQSMEVVPSPAKTVAIHLRAGDISVTNFSSGIQDVEGWVHRWIPISFYKELVEAIRRDYPGWQIVIYSEGSTELFAPLQEHATLVLDGDMRVAFHGLVTASILIMARSTFSWAAALLNTGTVFHAGDQPELQEWRSVEEFGVRLRDGYDGQDIRSACWAYNDPRNMPFLGTFIRQVGLYAQARVHGIWFFYQPSERIASSGPAATPEEVETFCGIPLLSVQESRCSRITTRDVDADVYLRPDFFFTADVRLLLRHAYDRGPPKPPPTPELTVIIHIQASKEVAQYGSLLKALQTRWPGWACTVYANGPEELFAPLRSLATLVVNGDDRVALHSMVTAPVLVMAAGSELSWAAALLNSGEVYYPVVIITWVDYYLGGSS